MRRTIVRVEEVCSLIIVQLDIIGQSSINSRLLELVLGETIAEKNRRARARVLEIEVARARSARFWVPIVPHETNGSTEQAVMESGSTGDAQQHENSEDQSTAAGDSSAVTPTRTDEHGMDEDVVSGDNDVSAEDEVLVRLILSVLLTAHLQ